MGNWEETVRSALDVTMRAEDPLGFWWDVFLWNLGEAGVTESGLALALAAALAAAIGGGIGYALGRRKARGAAPSR